MDSISLIREKMTAAIRSLPNNTPDARQSVYRKAREILTFSKYAHLAPELEAVIGDIESRFESPASTIPSAPAPAPITPVGRGLSPRLILVSGGVVLVLAAIATKLMMFGSVADPEFDHGFSQYSASPVETEAIPSWTTYYTAKVEDSVSLVEAKGPVPLYSKHTFPVVEGKSYMVSTRVRALADDPGRKGALTSVGIVALDENGTTIGPDFRSGHYAAMNLMLLTTKDGWKTGEGRLTWDSPDPVTLLPAGTKSVRVVALLNMSSPEAVSQIDYIRFGEAPSP